ncbi:hypothetical protein HDU98_011016 [Podochytrium sp. JEL0797]|nr:hypothetical protein HDU98_011016 [Podochytrium sp. JEL0797]
MPLPAATSTTRPARLTAKSLLEKATLSSSAQSSLATLIDDRDIPQVVASPTKPGGSVLPPKPRLTAKQLIQKTGQEVQGPQNASDTSPAAFQFAATATTTTSDSLPNNPPKPKLTARQLLGLEKGSVRDVKPVASEEPKRVRFTTDPTQPCAVDKSAIPYEPSITEAKTGGCPFSGMSEDAAETGPDSLAAMFGCPFGGKKREVVKPVPAAKSGSCPVSGMSEDAETGPGSLAAMFGCPYGGKKRESAPAATESKSLQALNSILQDIEVDLKDLVVIDQDSNREVTSRFDSTLRKDDIVDAYQESESDSEEETDSEYDDDSLSEEEEPEEDPQYRRYDDPTPFTLHHTSQLTSTTSNGRLTKARTETNTQIMAKIKMILSDWFREFDLARAVKGVQDLGTNQYNSIILNDLLKESMKRGGAAVARTARLLPELVGVQCVLMSDVQCSLAVTSVTLATLQQFIPSCFKYFGILYGAMTAYNHRCFSIAVLREMLEPVIIKEVKSDALNAPAVLGQMLSTVLMMKGEKVVKLVVKGRDEVVSFWPEGRIDWFGVEDWLEENGLESLI